MAGVGRDTAMVKHRVCSSVELTQTIQDRLFEELERSILKNGGKIQTDELHRAAAEVLGTKYRNICSLVTTGT